MQSSQPPPNPSSSGSTSLEDRRPKSLGLLKLYKLCQSKSNKISQTKNATPSAVPSLRFNDIAWPFRSQPSSLADFPNTFEAIKAGIDDYLKHSPENSIRHPGLSWQEKYFYFCREWDEEAFEDGVLKRVVEGERDDVKEAYEGLRVVLDELEKSARGVVPRPYQRQTERKWEECYWDECLR